MKLLVLLLFPISIACAIWVGITIGKKEKTTAKGILFGTLAAAIVGIGLLFASSLVSLVTILWIPVGTPP